MSSVELCVLASGSAGNCAAVRFDGKRLLLIDCGLSPRATAERLAAVGASLDDVTAVCLTHLDRDHFLPAWGADAGPGGTSACAARPTPPTAWRPTWPERSGSAASCCRSTTAGRSRRPRA